MLMVLVWLVWFGSRKYTGADVEVEVEVLTRMSPWGWVVSSCDLRCFVDIWFFLVCPAIVAGVFLHDVGGSGLVWIKGDAKVGVEVPIWSCLY